MSEFSGKVALVVGATVGIGRATAVAFARAGAKVVLSGRREQEGAETLSLVKNAGGDGIFIPTDVRHEAEVQTMIEQAVNAFGRVDFAYNNAGAEATKDLDQTTEAEFDVMMDTNVKGTFFCLKHEIRAMLKTGGGAIVNASSVTGFIPVPGHSIYVASKHAVIGLTKSAALEYGKQGIRVNAVCGATIDGTMLRTFLEKSGWPLEKVTPPIGRIGQPEDIANAVLFLCSAKASYINGVALPVDGGFLL
jgi:NAD(P)-dependent dehydrogenase (short-subunit alcohol dehydrogenase family)